MDTPSTTPVQTGLFGTDEPVAAPAVPAPRPSGGWCRPGESGRPIVLSFGGGVQTTALCAAVLRGLLPRPERVVMADTGREGTPTWEYLRTVTAPALAEVGLEVEVAGHDLATVDLFSTKGAPLMPLYTRAEAGADGEPGQLGNFCSGEWKRRVVRRHLRERGYGPESRGLRPVEMWMGMSLDEAGRFRTADAGWITTAWPLAIGLGWDRARCVREVEALGWPPPPKSSCVMCPYRSDAHHLETKTHHPEDWALALATEAEVRAVDPDAYVHRSGVPLSEVDLDPSASTAELPCTSGFCSV